MSCLFQAGKCRIKSFLREKKGYRFVFSVYRKLGELLACLLIKVDDERNMHTILLFLSVFQKKHGLVTFSALSIIQFRRATITDLKFNYVTLLLFS